MYNFSFDLACRALSPALRSNQNSLIGLFPSEMYQEAELFEDALAQNDDKEWGEWPLLSSDGDVVALLELVSENKVCGYDTLLHGILM